MADNRKKILEIIYSLDCGGIQTLMTSICSCAEMNKFQIDFLTFTDRKEFFDDKIKESGSNIIKLPPLKHGFFKKIPLYKQLYNVINKNHYDIVHVHGSNPGMLRECFISRMAGSKNTICHMHSIWKPQNNSRFSRDNIYARILPLVVNGMIACSQEASECLVSSTEQYETLILKNGIIVSDFQYSSSDRYQIRKSLGLEEKLVIGHVGRFTSVKNHDFLLEVFKKVTEAEPKAVLLLVGNGELEEKIREKAKQLGLTDKVIFAGVTDKVNLLYQAMDVFAFPSLFEGFGTVTIEAQCSGLPCIVSEYVPHAVKVTELLELLPLDGAAGEWSDAILKYRNGYNRKDFSDCIRKAGYDIRNSAAKLQEFYDKLFKINLEDR